jgi:hypothetical protein
MSELPKSERRDLTIRMHPALEERLKVAAVRERCAASDIIQAALLPELERREQGKRRAVAASA